MYSFSLVYLWCPPAYIANRNQSFLALNFFIPIWLNRQNVICAHCIWLTTHWQKFPHRLDRSWHWLICKEQMRNKVLASSTCDVGTNSLSTIPAEITKLVSLEHLQMGNGSCWWIHWFLTLYYNPFKSIPEVLTNLKNLKAVCLCIGVEFNSSCL